ncbi:MAG: FMN-binding glutamate synthase family protein [Bacilli bacterium]
MLSKMLLKILNPVIDDLVIQMFTKDYRQNPYIAVTAIQKLGAKDIIDAQLRAESGKILSLPYGSNIQFSPWEKILLNPRQVFELPTKELASIGLETVIGKNCKKPLKLSMPIMVTGMSYGGSLSLKMKIALAKGTSTAGTSTNTGESVVAKETRANAKYLIGQLHRGNLMLSEDLKLVDAIEVRLGQGAWGGNTESTTYAKDIDERLRVDWRLAEGEDKVFSSRIAGIDTPADVRKLINNLKKEYDVPIGIKISATDFIERELDVITSTKCDYIVIDGCEGGTAVAPPTLEDNLGLPTLYALIRTINYLKRNKIRDKFDLIIAGGLTNPGHFLKAIALGADAVYIGSIAVFAAIHNQVVKTLPRLPPTELVLGGGQYKDELDIDLAARSISNFLMSCAEEMKLALQAMAKQHISELSIDDLVSLDKNISECGGIHYGLDSRIDN